MLSGSCRNDGIRHEAAEVVAAQTAIPLARQRANMSLVAQNWDDLLRLAGSRKLGLVQAGGLMRTLQTNDRPTKLARALEEWGRVVKDLNRRGFDHDGERSP